jgi:hypothetical protein
VVTMCCSTILHSVECMQYSASGHAMFVRRFSCLKGRCVGTYFYALFHILFEGSCELNVHKILYAWTCCIQYFICYIFEFRLNTVVL